MFGTIFLNILNLSVIIYHLSLSDQVKYTPEELTDIVNELAVGYPLWFPFRSNFCHQLIEDRCWRRILLVTNLWFWWPEFKKLLYLILYCLYFQKQNTFRVCQHLVYHSEIHADILVLAKIQNTAPNRVINADEMGMVGVKTESL